MKSIFKWFVARRKIKNNKLILKAAGFIIKNSNYNGCCNFCNQWFTKISIETEIRSPAGEIFKERSGFADGCLRCDQIFRRGYDDRRYNIVEFVEKYAPKPVPIRHLYQSELDELEARAEVIKQKLALLPVRKDSPYRLSAKNE